MAQAEIQKRNIEMKQVKPEARQAATKQQSEAPSSGIVFWETVSNAFNSCCGARKKNSARNSPDEEKGPGGPMV